MQFISALHSKLPLACTMDWILQVVSHLCSTVKSDQPPYLFFLLFCFEGITMSLQTSVFTVTFTVTRPVAADIVVKTGGWSERTLCSYVKPAQTAEALQGFIHKHIRACTGEMRLVVSVHYCNKTCRGRVGCTTVSGCWPCCFEVLKSLWGCMWGQKPWWSFFLL